MDSSPADALDAGVGTQGECSTGSRADPLVISQMPLANRLSGGSLACMDDMMEPLLRGAAIAALRLPRVPETVADFESCILSTYGGSDDAQRAAQRKVMALALKEAKAHRPLGVATCLDEIRRLRAATPDIGALPESA